MGILQSLFGKKDNNADKGGVVKNIVNKASQAIGHATTVQELVMMTKAPNYKIDETKYPVYLRSQYGIGFPREVLRKLEKEGYIKPATAIESLPQLKVTELKTIASQFGLKSTGTKETLCSIIADNVPVSEIEDIVSERYWLLTEQGTALLEQNPHINYYLENHPYSLQEIGLDINTYHHLFEKKPNGRVRDIVWGELNRKSVESYKKAVTKKEFFDYCQILRTMALFLEEENRHEDSLATYMRYLYYRINIKSSYSAFSTYMINKKFDNAADTLFINAEILPGLASEIKTIAENCGYDSKQLSSYMKKTFSQEHDTGAFSPAELTDFIMCGINGDKSGQKKICKSVMKSAAKKLPKK